MAQLKFFKETQLDDKQNNQKTGFFKRMYKIPTNRFSILSFSQTNSKNDDITKQMTDLNNEIQQLKEIHKDFFECITNHHNSL